jgi:hypothetical protein
VLHNLDDSLGVSFLEAKQNTEEGDEPLLPALWHKYTYRSRHRQYGLLKRALVTVSLMVGALWLTQNG